MGAYPPDFGRPGRPGGGGKDGDVLDRNEPDAGAVAAGDAEVRIVSASTDAARRVADTLRHRLADGQRCG
ncbi:hypothetical protein ACFWGM_20570 [Streptomyces roseolus]|uniref:hypothetical protein n=1 Tax=Streptomyces roseolus TaxID=67358 RepID=UPI00362575DA